MILCRRNAVWRQRRHVLQEIIPDSFWTALSRFDNGTWTAYTPGFAYEGALLAIIGPAHYDCGHFLVKELCMTRKHYVSVV